MFPKEMGITTASARKLRKVSSLQDEIIFRLSEREAQEVLKLLLTKVQAGK